MPDNLEPVFRALANESRRHLLDRLRTQNGLTQAALQQDSGMTQQAVAQHLGILEAANLVTPVWHGREKLHYLNPIPLQAIADRWISKFERTRVRVLADLKQALEESNGE